MRVEFGGRVPVGIGLEIDADGAVDARVDVDREILDRTRRQHVEPARRRADPHVRREVHDVDRRPEERPVVAAAEVTADVLAAVALVPQRTGQRKTGGGDEAGEGDVGADVEAQRHDVGHHPHRGLPRPGVHSRTGEAAPTDLAAGSRSGHDLVRAAHHRLPLRSRRPDRRHTRAAGLRAAVVARGDGARRRLGQAARAHAAHATCRRPSTSPTAAENVVGGLLLDHPAAVVVIVIGPGGDAGPPAVEFVERVMARLAEHGVDGCHALWTGSTSAGSRWRCYGECGCTGLVPPSSTSPLMAAARAEGRVVRADRSELERLVAPVDERVLRRREALLDAAVDAEADATFAAFADLATPASAPTTGASNPAASTPPRPPLPRPPLPRPPLPRPPPPRPPPPRPPPPRPPPPPRRVLRPEVRRAGTPSPAYPARLRQMRRAGAGRGSGGAGLTRASRSWRGSRCSMPPSTRRRRRWRRSAASRGPPSPAPNPRRHQTAVALPAAHRVSGPTAGSTTSGWWRSPGRCRSPWCATPPSPPAPGRDRLRQRRCGRRWPAAHRIRRRPSPPRSSR